MLHITLSQQSINKLEAMPFSKRINILNAISRLNLSDPDNEKKLRKFSRRRHIFYRYRHSQWRLYIKKESSQTLNIHCILDKNGISDFIFRCNLPYRDEMHMENHKDFIGYLNSVTEAKS